MTDFTKILDKAKELEVKMKESQEKIKKIEAVGISGSNSVKVTLNGENEMIEIKLSDEIMKEDKEDYFEKLNLSCDPMISGNKYLQCKVTGIEMVKQKSNKALKGIIHIHILLKNGIK